MSKLVELEESENYAIIYLNRPDQLNALNIQLAEELYSVLEKISKNDKIRCVIITGKGKANAIYAYEISLYKC